MLRMPAIALNALPRHPDPARDDQPQYCQLEHGASFSPIQWDIHQTLLRGAWKVLDLDQKPPENARIVNKSPYERDRERDTPSSLPKR
jgi:hypothetical protein